MHEENQEEEFSKDELAKLSGESGIRRFKFVVPNLKFNGSTGAWSLLSEKDGNWTATDVTGPIELVILKARRTLTSYDKVQNKGVRTFTNEHDTWKDALTVFEKHQDDERAQIIGTGTIDDIRKQFPKLRLKMNLYCLMGKDIVKLGVKGKSLSSLFEFYKTFSSDEHVFEYKIKLTSHTEKNEGGLTYFVIDWEKGKPSNMKEVSAKIREVSSSIELQDKQYREDSAKQFQDDPKPLEDYPGPADEVVFPDITDEEVKSEDIPD